MSKKFYVDSDFKKNALIQAKIESVSAFPSNAKEGQMIYHTTFNAFFVCINENMTGGTSQKGAWGIGNITIDDLYHTESVDKILITDAGNAFRYDDVDGGNF